MILFSKNPNRCCYVDLQPSTATQKDGSLGLGKDHTLGEDSEANECVVLVTHVTGTLVLSLINK